MTAEPEELFPPPPPPGPIFGVELTCEAPASAIDPGGYQQTFTSSQQQPNGFYPWTVVGSLGTNPTSFTLIGTAIAYAEGKALPATAEVKIVSQDVDPNFEGNGPPINLSASASGEGRATATLVVDLTKYDATPNNNFQLLATTSVSGTGAGRSETITVPLLIITPEG